MKISIVGAYGYTGQLICEEFDFLKIPYTIVGRNKQKLEDLKKRLNSPLNAYCLDILLDSDCDFLISNSDIIVNCAGPFTEESQLLLKKIAESGKVYFDVSGELEFIKTSRENYHQKAIASKSLIVHACAFESLLTDLVIQKLKFESDIMQTIRTFYLFEQARASPGTRITMKLAKFRKKLKISAYKWKESDLTKDIFDIKLPNETNSFRAIVCPLPEIAFSFWSHQLEIAESFLLVKLEESKFIIPRATNPDAILPTLKKLNERKIIGPTKAQRQGQKSKIVIQVISKKGKEKMFLLESSDMYQTTAKAIVFSVKQLLEKPNHSFGVLNPAVIFRNEENELLAKLGVKICDEVAISIEKPKIFK